jgi:hypothetical protein
MAEVMMGRLQKPGNHFFPTTFWRKTQELVLAQDAPPHITRLG